MSRHGHGVDRVRQQEHAGHGADDRDGRTQRDTQHSDAMAAKQVDNGHRHVAVRHSLDEERG